MKKADDSSKHRVLECVAWVIMKILCESAPRILDEKVKEDHACGEWNDYFDEPKMPF